MAHAVRPGYEDARLLVHLAEWHGSSGLTAALRWLWGDQFVSDYEGFIQRYPPGSEGDRMAALICDSFQMLGTLHKHGLVNEDLLFDWLLISPIWDRLKEYARGQRRGAAGPGLWCNFEAMAASQKRALGEYST
jgi:hypothetical protein